MKDGWISVCVCLCVCVCVHVCVCVCVSVSIHVQITLQGVNNHYSQYALCVCVLAITRAYVALIR